MCYRDIQDKYKMTLTPDAHAQIQRAAGSYQLSHTVFIRTQYDVLRRLRTYWVPRFILHMEKANELRYESPSARNEWVIVYFPALKVLQEFLKNS